MLAKTLDHKEGVDHEIPRQLEKETNANKYIESWSSILLPPIKSFPGRIGGIHGGGREAKGKYVEGRSQRRSNQKSSHPNSLLLVHTRQTQMDTLKKYLKKQDTHTHRKKEGLKTPFCGETNMFGGLWGYRHRVLPSKKLKLLTFPQNY